MRTRVQRVEGERALCRGTDFGERGGGSDIAQKGCVYEAGSAHGMPRREPWIVPDRIVRVPDACVQILGPTLLEIVASPQPRRMSFGGNYCWARLVGCGEGLAPHDVRRTDSDQGRRRARER